MVMAQRTAHPAKQNARTPRHGKNSTKVRSTIFIVACIAVWELVFHVFPISPLILVPPTAIARSFYKLLLHGNLVYHFSISMIEFLEGFILAAVVGIGLGVLIGMNKTLRDYLDVSISALYAMPIIAISPLLIMWFGIGAASKVAVVFSVSVFSILISTSAGVQAVDANFIETAKCFGLSRKQVFFKVLIPSSLPFIISGLRLGLGRGLIGVVVGELFAARAGLGYLIYTASQVFDTATLLVGVVIFSIVGVVGTEFLKWLEDYIAPWRKLARAGIGE